MKKYFIFSLLVGFSLLLLTPVFAGPLTQGIGNLKTSVKGTGLESSTLEDTVGTVIKAVLAMVGTIFLVLTIYAGILWMTASGNDEQVTKATSIIKAAIIGLAITMSAYAITFFIASKVGGGAGGGGASSSVVDTGSQNDDNWCELQGGLCDYHANVGDDCDAGIYDGSSPGMCTLGGTRERICCILESKFISDSEDEKCKKAGGVCYEKECGGETTPHVLDVGFDCEDEHTPDWNCCITP